MPRAGRRRAGPRCLLSSSTTTMRTVRPHASRSDLWRRTAARRRRPPRAPSPRGVRPCWAPRCRAAGGNRGGAPFQDPQSPPLPPAAAALGVARSPSSSAHDGRSAARRCGPRTTATRRPTAKSGGRRSRRTSSFEADSTRRMRRGRAHALCCARGRGRPAWARAKGVPKVTRWLRLRCGRRKGAKALTGLRSSSPSSTSTFAPTTTTTTTPRASAPSVIPFPLNGSSFSPCTASSRVPAAAPSPACGASYPRWSRRASASPQTPPKMNALAVTFRLPGSGASGLRSRGSSSSSPSSRANYTLSRSSRPTWSPKTSRASGSPQARGP
mmetsp:Transcript_4317/g.12476  ORF Transcript_4317/g.12476 Transcript_4317/m.12476 type:complete len:327 (-) Transcript_4317:297-1277(-)